MYKCVKLISENLNPGSSLTHLTNTYTYRVTTACGGIF